MHDTSKMDNAYFNRLQDRLRTATICDILDDMGYRHQATHGTMHPLDDGYRLLGRVRTMLTYDVVQIPDQPYYTEIEAVDRIRPGDVIVVGTNHFGHTGNFSNGFWGELMATAAIGHGGRGVILDGAVRDIVQLKALGDRFKVFAAGRNPLDSKGRCLVSGYDCPIVCDGVQVNPLDYVFADVDGVVFIPENVFEQVIERTLEKSCKEDGMRKDLLLGESLKDAFARHKIL